MFGAKEKSKNVGKVFYAPWEKAFDRVLTPFDEFIHRQSTSGLILMTMAVVALLLANSPLSAGYENILKTYFKLSFGGFELKLSLQHWINDGLMAYFFLLVGLELKREFLVGELADTKKAVLPIMAAIGGMVIPAGLYAVFNIGGPGAGGWGIPMATDIAFAVGIITLMGNTVPKSLVTFLVALAIVDDLGAIAVIAVFYTEQLNFAAAAWVGALTFLLVAMNFGGIRRTGPYMFVGVLLWFALLKTGIHATLAGVVVAFTIPAMPKFDAVAFATKVKRSAVRIGDSANLGIDIMRNDELRANAQSLKSGIELAQAPLQKVEHGLHTPVTYFIVPLFALANAGIPFSAFSGDVSLLNNVTLGVIVGLFFGKLIGIAGAVWLGRSFGLGLLPKGCNMMHIVGVALLGGIGFTMSIFIAELAFAGSEQLILAKGGILIASLLSGIFGYIALKYAGKSKPGR
ncbi:sodium/proton antiporter (NhaA family) [Sinobacterium caligoides]|uniref:Na(+)/H(+) antiporter NhaA n=1 Tax=Sinobacterium caligoides TaxID=933926 RepID=A0A3N2DYE5_9GAMM|nr:Na+/H+ antiporter NhaA [Sinobacterium caligoides]ROS04794.1 sodium/proton antiporter (NhaA family) [Sinobacterium caligoides]